VMSAICMLFARNRRNRAETGPKPVGICAKPAKLAEFIKKVIYTSFFFLKSVGFAGFARIPTGFGLVSARFRRFRASTVHSRHLPMSIYMRGARSDLFIGFWFKIPKSFRAKSHASH